MTAQRQNIVFPEEFLEYEGIRVYRTYRFNDPINYPPSPHLFTTALDGTYDNDPFRFDVRNLIVPAASAGEEGLRSGDEPAITSVLHQAIDRGMISTPNEMTESGSRPVQVFQENW
jgi:hypothetical protein